MTNKKARSVWLLSMALLLLSNPVWAVEGVNSQDLAPTSQELEKKEVRDQDMLVPTNQGVQKATKTEYDTIKKLEKKNTDELVGAYIVGDYSSGQILMAKDGDKPVGLASTTKLMTIYVALDAIKSGQIKWSDPVIIDKEASSLTGSSYKTKENEVYTVEELIHAGLIVSGNDAMIALAKHIAGSQAAFIQKMHEKARDLGLESAHFINVHGLTDYSVNDYNRMSTNDLFILSRNLLKDYPEILEISKRPYIKEEGRKYICYNTNPILGIVPEVDGLKTGYTNAAGRCLVATSLSKDEGDKKATRIIGVFMNSPDNWSRFVVSKRIMEEAALRYSYETIANPKNSLDILSLEKASPSEVPVYPEKAKEVLLDSGKYFRKDLEYDPISLPVKKGDRVGRVKYYLGDDLIYESPLVVHEDIGKPNLVLHFKDKVRKAFHELDTIVAQGSAL